MKCKYCGKEIDEGSVFCGYCGKQQPKVMYCIKCGKEIGSDDVFCGYCGASQKSQLPNEEVYDEKNSPTDRTIKETFSKKKITSVPLKRDDLNISY